MAEAAPQSVSPPRRSSPAGKSWWTPVMSIQAVLLAIVLVVHYRHVIYSLVYKWQNDGDWSHGFLIPLFSLYYLYLQRDRMPLGLVDRRAVARLVGAGLMILAFAMYLGCTLARIDYPKSVSLVLTILGVVLMVCGWVWTRWSWFAILFLVFALPVPQRLYVQLTMPLRYIAADVSATVLNTSLQDMEAVPKGALVEYSYEGKAGSLDIEQACSGIRLLMTMMALGVAMAFVSDRPLWHRQIMILACIPISILCNIIRVTATGFMVVFGRDDLARGFPHMMLGLGMLFIAFSLFGSISFVLNHLFVEDETNDRCSMATGGSSA